MFKGSAHLLTPLHLSPFEILPNAWHFPFQGRFRILTVKLKKMHKEQAVLSKPAQPPAGQRPGVGSYSKTKWCPKTLFRFNSKVSFFKNPYLWVCLEPPLAWEGGRWGSLCLDSTFPRDNKEVREQMRTSHLPNWGSSRSFSLPSGSPTAYGAGPLTDVLTRHRIHAGRGPAPSICRLQQG